MADSKSDGTKQPIGSDKPEDSFTLLDSPSDSKSTGVAAKKPSPSNASTETMKATSARTKAFNDCAIVPEIVSNFHHRFPGLLSKSLNRAPSDISFGELAPEDGLSGQFHELSGQFLPDTFNGYAEIPAEVIAKFMSEDHGQEVAGPFVPHLDVFSTKKVYVLHFAVPGASKDDVDVSWEPEKSSLMVNGVVYRPGSQQLVRSLITSERKIGMFKRHVQLPPPGTDENEEVDGLGITAKMENGILVVTVPKLEKESIAEFHKVEVE